MIAGGACPVGQARALGVGACTMLDMFAQRREPAEVVRIVGFVFEEPLAPGDRRRRFRLLLSNHQLRLHP